MVGPLVSALAAVALAGLALSFSGPLFSAPHAGLFAVPDEGSMRHLVLSSRGLAWVLGLAAALVALGLVRRAYSWRDVLTYHDGTVGEDGLLWPDDGGEPLALGCSCAKEPGKQILYRIGSIGSIGRIGRADGDGRDGVRGGEGAPGGPYRRHAARDGVIEHATLSREEAATHARQLARWIGACCIASASVSILVLRGG